MVASIYKVSAVPMGSKFGPCYAFLFVGYQEHVIINSFHGPFPWLIKRYMDGIIGATYFQLDSMQEFIDYTNNCHPALRFTHNITEQCLPFLNILLTIKDDRISTTIYYEETHAHSFLNCCSQRPKNPKILPPTQSPSHLYQGYI